MIQNSSIVIQRSAIRIRKFSDKILNQLQTLVIMLISPKDLHLKNTNKTFQLISFKDPRNQIFIYFQFFTKLGIESCGSLDEVWHLESETFVKGIEVMSLNNITIFFDIFSDPRDSPSFFIINCLI